MLNLQVRKSWYQSVRNTYKSKVRVSLDTIKAVTGAIVSKLTIGYIIKNVPKESQRDFFVPY
jgi:hypothetical protein